MSWTMPQLPQAFWGEVYVNGKPAPKGTVVEARAKVEGVVLVRPTSQNPLIMTESGVVGGSGAFDPKIIVQGDLRPDGSGPIPSRTPIFFLVDGKVAWVLRDEGWWAQYVPFESFDVTHVILIA